MAEGLTGSRTAQNIMREAVRRLDSSAESETRRFLTRVGKLPDFIFQIAQTLDEHDEDRADVAPGQTIVPGNPFPDWPYLHEIIEEVYPHQKHIFVEKTRQLMVTWLFAAVVVWEVRRPGQRWGWISLKLEHADEALERMWKIIERMPGRAMRAPGGNRAFLDAGGVRWEKSFGHIAVPSLASNIHGMSQNADDCRSFTFSGLVADEWAFQPAAKQAYAAAKPTIDTGRFIGITTPGPFGFVHDISRGKVFNAEGE